MQQDPGTTKREALRYDFGRSKKHYRGVEKMKNYRNLITSNIPDVKMVSSGKSTFIDELRCPKCKKGLFSPQGMAWANGNQSIQCQLCGEVFPIIDGIYHFYKDRRNISGLDYSSLDWLEREKERERQYEVQCGFSHSWIRSLPYPAIETETTFQKKSGTLGENFFNILSQLSLKGSERVFDVAAGCCWTSNEFAKYGCKVVSTDIRTIKYHGLRSAEAYFEASEVRFERLCWSFGRIPFDDEHFDIVFCQNAFQYVQDLASMIKEVHRVLKPGGRFVLAWTGVRAPLKSKKWGPGHYITEYCRATRKMGFSIHIFSPTLLWNEFGTLASKRKIGLFPIKFFQISWKSKVFRRIFLRFLSIPSIFLFGIPFNMIAIKT